MSDLLIFAGMIVLGIVAIALIFVTLSEHKSYKKYKTKKVTKTANESADAETSKVFNDEFREELRNRGRLHFEKIIGENAMFLQQDLRLTTSQLNEYMKTEITKKLQVEFKKYEESIMDAKQLAVESIDKTNVAIEEQRAALGTQLQEQVGAEKAHLIERFENDMASVINHYVLAAIGSQIDMSDQLDFIISELEAHKKEIIQDISNG